jgi:hypothetical protein
MADMVISLFLAWLFWYLLFHKKGEKKDKPLRLPEIPGVTDAQFEEKLASYIRTFLSRKYSPEHTQAHTLEEIKLYAKWHPLLSVLTELETSLYTSKRLWESKRIELIKRVKV